MERKNGRKTLIGKVVSDKSQKTIIVAVDTYITHRIYHKRFKVTKKFATHDEHEQAKIGDIVKIAETRPYSKTKTFRLVEIRQVAKEGAK